MDKCLLQSKLEEYRDYKGLADNYKKRADKVALEIKVGMEQEPIISHNGIIFERRTTVKEKLNDEMLFALLEAQNLDEAFKVVKVLDEEKVSELIKSGVIELSTIAECTDSKEIVSLYMKKEKVMVAENGIK